MHPVSSISTWKIIAWLYRNMRLITSCGVSFLPDPSHKWKRKRRRFIASSSEKCCGAQRSRLRWFESFSRGLQQLNERWDSAVSSAQFYARKKKGRGFMEWSCKTSRRLVIKYKILLLVVVLSCVFTCLKKNSCYITNITLINLLIPGRSFYYY